MADHHIRTQAWEALKLHNTDTKYAEALTSAADLARANPGYAPALHLAGSLHIHAAITAWTGRDPGDDEAASQLESYHYRAAIDALSAAARIAPNCVMSAVLHAQALFGDQRFADALGELSRVLSMPEANHHDPAVHHVVYDLIGTTTAKRRKSDAVDQAGVLMRKVKTTINNEVVPSEAMELLGGNAAVDQKRERAELLRQTYPTSVRAQLLRVYIELEQVRALDLAVDRRRLLLRRSLALISDAAGNFDSSLLIALFHAKILFALDKFDESETECRRALRIKEPNDPNLDDIPPAVSVPGADYESRVSSVQKQLRVLLKRIIVVAAVCWSSIKSAQQHPERVDRVISVRVDTLQEHYNRIDQSAAKTISDALRFLENQSSWSFLICPNSNCKGKKFVDTEKLWAHMRSKHKDGLWEKLQSLLGPDLYENTSKDDHSLDGMTLCQDSHQHDIFQLPRVQPMFESLLISPSIGIQAEPLAEMQQRKCSRGAEILDCIKKKLRMLPKDKHSTEFAESCFAIQDLWLNFLEASALDHREVILPLARSIQYK